MIPFPTNEQLALAYKEINPMHYDVSLFESLRLTLPTGTKQSVTVTPATGYVLYIQDIGVDSYPNATYTFVVGNMTFAPDGTYDRDGKLSFTKPVRIGEGDRLFIEVYNGEVGTIKYGVEIKGWARLAEHAGVTT